MELNPRLKLRSPMEMPLRMPKSMTVFTSTALLSKKFKRCAAWRVQNVTIRCQLVSVVAKYNKTKRRKLKTREKKKGLNNRKRKSIITSTFKLLTKERGCVPKGKPRLLIKALLQMTIETDDATERNSAPITPS